MLVRVVPVSGDARRAAERLGRVATNQLVVRRDIRHPLAFLAELLIDDRASRNSSRLCAALCTASRFPFHHADGTAVKD